jgi:hypothetical protein
MKKYTKGNTGRLEHYIEPFLQKVNENKIYRNIKNNKWKTCGEIPLRTNFIYEEYRI